MKRSWVDSPFYVPTFFGIMTLGLLILFGDFLFSGQMLYGSDFVEAGFYHRSLLVDHFKEFNRMPQWDPHEFGGMPYVDAFHGDTFYPLSVLKFFIPLYYHFGLCLVLHIYLAGIFMFLTAREFGLGQTASLFSGASYMFAAYLISLVASGHDGNIYVASLFPLIMLFLHRSFNIKPFFNFTLLGLILGIIFLSPHPRMSYFTLWAVALYTLYRLALAFIQTRNIKNLFKPATLVAYAVAIAFLFSAIQFYPGYIYASQFSVRTKKQDNWRWATSWSLHEEDVVSQLIPEFSGFTSKTDQANNYWGRNAFKDSTETVGIVPLFLGLIGMIFSRRKDAYFFGGLALFAFIYALGATTPFFKLFYNLIPKVDSLRAPAMIMFLFSFSVALLAGMGIQTIIKWKTESDYKPSKWFYYLLSAPPLLMFVLGALFSLAGTKLITLWTSLFFKDAFKWEVENGMTKFEIALQNLSLIQSGAWIGFIFTALAAALIWIYLNKKGPTWLLSVLILIPVIDGVRFDSRFVSVVSPDRYLKSDVVTDFFLSRPGNYRVFNDGTKYPTTLLHKFGIETVDGYHGNQLRWYDKLQEGPQSTKWNNPRFLNLVGTRYLLVLAGAGYPSDYFGTTPLKTERSFEDFSIFRNDNAFPRVYLVNSFEVISDPNELIRKVLVGQSDLSQIVYLETPPDIQIPKVEIGNDSAWMVSRSFDSVEVGVKCTVNRLLVLTDNYYDSWQVYVDGQPASLGRAYGSFRAVAVPAGSKEVLFKYQSNRYALGKAISIVTSIYLLIVLGAHYCLCKTKELKVTGRGKE